MIHRRKFPHSYTSNTKENRGSSSLFDLMQIFEKSPHDEYYIRTKFQRIQVKTERALEMMFQTPLIESNLKRNAATGLFAELLKAQKQAGCTLNTTVFESFSPNSNLTPTKQSTGYSFEKRYQTEPSRNASSFKAKTDQDTDPNELRVGNLHEYSFSMENAEERAHPKEESTIYANEKEVSYFTLNESFGELLCNNRVSYPETEKINSQKEEDDFMERSLKRDLQDLKASLSLVIQDENKSSQLILLGEQNIKETTEENPKRTLEEPRRVSYRMQVDIRPEGNLNQSIAIIDEESESQSSLSESPILKLSESLTEPLLKAKGFLGSIAEGSCLRQNNPEINDWCD